MSVAEIASRQDRPAYVTFKREPVQDHARSQEVGHYVAKDVDFAHITPPYSKDVFITKVTDWLSNLDRDVAAGRLPQEWAANYKRAYQAWQSGQEIPLNGTPIKGWGIISPAMQETLVKQNIRTVEDLAACNDEGLRRLGMGAVELKNRAHAWLNTAKDTGKIAMENARLNEKVSMLEHQVESLTSQMKTYAAAANANIIIQERVEEIASEDIIEPPPPPKRGPGRPRKEA